LNTIKHYETLEAKEGFVQDSGKRTLLKNNSGQSKTIPLIKALFRGVAKEHY